MSQKESLFSAKNMKLLTGPLDRDNPVTIQILGICSALAVTAQLKPALVMAISVTVVTAFANLIISMMRNGIPNRIRIIVQLVVVAALDYGRPNTTCLRLRCQQETFGIRRSYYYQLYHHGSLGGICAWQ